MIYKTTSFYYYIFPILFICLSIAAYYYDLNPIIIGVVGLIAFTSSLNDHLTIIVLEDSFNITYSNLFGKLMRTDNIFYIKDVIKFEYVVNAWSANFIQSIIIILVSFIMPGTPIRLSERPKTIVKITTKNSLGETDFVEMVLHTKNRDVLKALALIKNKCK